MTLSSLCVSFASLAVVWAAFGMRACFGMIGALGLDFSGTEVLTMLYLAVADLMVRFMLLGSM